MSKIGGVDIQDFKFLRDQILEHFATIKTFSTVTGLPYRKTLATFNNMEVDKKYFDEMNRMFKRHVKRGQVPFRISAEDRESVRLCILSNFKNYTEFCMKHKKYDVVYISNVCNVVNGLKLKSNKYVNLTNLLSKKYGLEIE